MESIQRQKTNFYFKKKRYLAPYFTTQQIMANQNPEQIARDHIDKQLIACGWLIQSKKELNLTTNFGIAVRELQTSVGPADYVLFVDKKPVGVIEAKREEEGYRLTAVEEQAVRYAHAKIKYIEHAMLPFVYQSTGTITHFTDYRDPKPRARNLFTFHRPETLHLWLKNPKTLRARFHDIPALNPAGLRDCQVQAVQNLENSFKAQHPLALIQMATGAGKTFMAITAIYRLLKFAQAKRILFLVDTKNLGEQAEAAFKSFRLKDVNRSFTELYGLVRLNSAFIPTDSQVYISTIQRMYSLMKGTDLDETAEEINPNEVAPARKEPMPVVYSPKVPIEFFDCIVIDECHRSIYNLWKQILDYFDAFQIGLTATPDKRTYSYFNQNVVSEYRNEKAIIDGVLVPYNVYNIQTQISKHGATIQLGEMVDKRARLTRKQIWESLDENIEYEGAQLDKDIVNPSQIRTIVQEINRKLPSMFPDRFDENGDFEVPKTLIFAKTDSHAEDIIKIVREEFGQGNDFCKKITYKSAEDPKSVLQQFRMKYMPRIAVTVDMIATGTDIQPLEVLVFMRDVRSRSYYEQMKGRGTRTVSLDELRKVSKTAKVCKDHFVLIDAIGVELSHKTDSRPLEKIPGLSLKDVLGHITIGQDTSEPMLSTLAYRLILLNRQISDKEKSAFLKISNGFSINQLVQKLLDAHDPDLLETLETNIRRQHVGAAPDAVQTMIDVQKEAIVADAVAIFYRPEVQKCLLDLRKNLDQIIDSVNLDHILNSNWVGDSETAANLRIQDFKTCLETHRNELIALQIFYNQPYRRRELTHEMVKKVFEMLEKEHPMLAPLRVWEAYATLGQTRDTPRSQLIALVSLLRTICGMDAQLTAFDKTVDKNFQTWVFKKQSGALKFNEQQMNWLRMMKDCVANSFHIEKDDFEYHPFDAQGGLSRMWQLFGAQTDALILELNEALAA
jgi:type I restriction enzyme, R subunit